MTTEVSGGAGLAGAGPSIGQGLQTDYQLPALTCDEELLCCLGPAFPPLAATDPARIRRIAAELADGFSRLDGVTRLRPACRFPPGLPLGP